MTCGSIVVRRQKALFAEPFCRRSIPARAAFTFADAFYAALRDIAHELGHMLGFFARSPLAFASLSDVADAGRGGIFRAHRSDHAVARGEIRRQRRADGHHVALDRRRGRRDLPRLPAGRPGRSATRSVAAGRRVAAGIVLHRRSRRRRGIERLREDAFGSAEFAAAAVAYAASQITRLTAFGDVATAERNTTPNCRRCAARSNATAMG